VGNHFSLSTKSPLRSYSHCGSANGLLWIPIRSLGCHDTSVCPKRSSPWYFWLFFPPYSSFVKLCFLTICYGIRDGPGTERGCRVPAAQRRTAIRPLICCGCQFCGSTPICYPNPRSRTDYMPYVSDVLIKVVYVFHVLSRFFLRINRGSSAILQYVCAHGMNKRITPKQKQSLSSETWKRQHNKLSWIS
jgi:hypothetical protein